MVDQIQREKVLEKLGKLKALAERGVGGEKETALRKYEELCEKYGISDDEAENALNEVETHWFSYSTPLEEELLTQIFYKVTGSPVHYQYKGMYSRRKRRGCDCTKVEAAEIDLLFSFYREEMKKELKVFMIAFKQKNHLYPEESARCYKEYDGPEKEMTEEELRMYKKAAFMRNFMDGNTPPRAAIEEREVAADERSRIDAGKSV